MRKFCLSLMALLIAASVMKAEDGFSVNPLTIPQGRLAELEILFESETAMYNRFQFEIQMPEGVSYVLTGENEIDCAKGELIAATNHTISASHIASLGRERFLCTSNTNRAIPAGKGVIMTVTYQADASLAVGTELTGYVKDLLWNDAENNEYTKESIPFTITIGEPRTLLDENSTKAPVAETGADVRVKRTIYANEWSTLCLPFDMTAAQVVSAFGSNVLLADFASWGSDEDNDGNIVSLSLGFNVISEITANRPCLIKTDKLIESFTVDGVDIDPDDEPVVQVGKKKAERGYMTGTYVAQTPVPENNLFLRKNEFWYSTGNTKMKAFRAYFELADVLTIIEELSPAKIRFTIEDETSSIMGISTSKSSKAGVYNLNGQFMGTNLDIKNLPKGIYIVDGKKIINN